MEMNREEALQHIHRNPEKYLKRAKKDGYICPICGSGGGPNGTGITTKDEGEHFTCWRGCFTSADIPDIIAKKEGLQPGGRDALQRAYEIYGIDIIPTGQTHSESREKKPQGGAAANLSKNPEVFPTSIKKEAATSEGGGVADYTAYCTSCHKNISKTDYPQRRGLTEKAISRFILGYDEAFKTRSAETGEYAAWRALIIPNGPYSFIARNTDPEAGERDRYRKRGPANVFNELALKQESAPVFIVEGELDAMSIIEAGGEAVALGSTANTDKLLKQIEKDPPKTALILALDRDEAGQKAEEALQEGLTRLGASFIRADICREYKDANEAHRADAAGFKQAIYAAQRAVTEAKEEALEAEKLAYMTSSAAGHLQEFIDGIAASADTRPFETGIPALDKSLDGGFYEGLIFIGGLTSTGKTTLALQICDNMAKQGHDAIVFSLEMARSELMAKSISREMLLECFRRNLPDSNAKTTRDILSGARHKEFSATEGALYDEALKAYGKYAGRLYIHEGQGDIGTGHIRETIEKHIRITGKKPVVLIDYLQLLAPYNERYSDKQNTDKAVMELKRMSRDYKTPVIAVSSFNRDSYTKEANQASFKETGGIEYSCDTLLALQYKGIGSNGFKLDTAAQDRRRGMEVVILKNSNAGWGNRIDFDFYAFGNYFHPTGRI